MTFRIKFWEQIQGYKEVTVTTLDIQDGFLVKGKFRTPISNIKYIEETT